ncbi:MAG: hypothetical protein DYG93_08760 [Leptolyngbya sp. PLA2]|nr:hypothetical protein [Leptolyngbya sp. PL-A2]
MVAASAPSRSSTTHHDTSMPLSAPRTTGAGGAGGCGRGPAHAPRHAASVASRQAMTLRDALDGQSAMGGHHTVREPLAVRAIP